jgi:hypothetical protein
MHWRSAWLTACSVALLVSGCGGEEEAAPPPRETITRAAAEALAKRSDAIAAALAAGDVCTAAGAADELKRAAQDAIDRGSVPPAYRQHLLRAADDLVNTVNCPPPTPPPAEEDEEDDDEDRGRGKGKPKKDKKGNDAGVTIEEPLDEELPPDVTVTDTVETP